MLNNGCQIYVCYSLCDNGKRKTLNVLYIYQAMALPHCCAICRTVENVKYFHANSFCFLTNVIVARICVRINLSLINKKCGKLIDRYAFPFL